MIQRIQSLYLLLVTCALTVSLCLPLGYFYIFDEEQVFKATGLLTSYGLHSTWGLFVLLLLVAIVSFFTIFLYKNRMLQIRLTIFSTLLVIGFYIVFIVFYIILKQGTTSFRVGWALCLPLVGLVLNILAIRAIGKDEVLVRAADRLR